MNKDYGKGICVICGKEFEKKSENAILCSDECRKLRKKQRNKEYDYKRYYILKKKTQEKKKKEKHKSRFNELTAEAKACGMSYGMLQAKRYMESMGR